MRAACLRFFLLFIPFFLCLAPVQGQQVGINILTPDSSAVLHVESDKMGFLPPRLTLSQRDSIANPAKGLVIYNVTDSALQIFNGECWLYSYQERCDECFFSITATPLTGQIDRIFNDTTGTTITINQTSVPAQTIGLFLFHNLPAGVTATLDNYTVSGSGPVRLTVHASIFADPGVYPIAVQGICGGTIRNAIFIVEIDTCYSVTVMGQWNQYNVQALHNLPGPGTPICVVVDVLPGAEVNSNDTLVPALQTGNLDPQSHVGLRNGGAILGRGGGGGVGGNFSSFGSPGGRGGVAVSLTTKTTIQNNGYIFGGGGGGGSVGFGQSFNIPIIGTWTLAIGAGGGGGPSLGPAGGTGGNSIPFWSNGNNATGGINGIPGTGGVLTQPISIPIQVVTINITPNVYGGNGGPYGVNGYNGTIQITIGVQVPIIGNINIPVPPITNFPPGGNAGNAVKRNGNLLLGMPDGIYQTNQTKGIVGP